MTDEVIDAEVVEGQELVHTEPPVLAVTPQVEAKELVARLGVIHDAMDNAMEKDTDYGVIPGTDKPALFKPGAEKLGVLFQLDVQVVNEKTWGPGDHLTVEAKATVFHAPTGARLGSGEGMCTTREKKYAYRQQERACPHCKQASVIKGKAEYGGGWLCWKKRDGCGAKFADGDTAIEGQEVGQIDNPDLPDLWNTVVKMAKKRAYVDAVLAVTGASALFTQDVAPDDPSGNGDGTPAAASPREGSDVASPKQLGFLTKLLADNGVPEPTLHTVTAWGSIHLTGGRGGTCSRAIEALKDSDDLDKRAKTVEWLVRSAEKWAGTQTDVPPDAEGLPDA